MAPATRKQAPSLDAWKFSTMEPGDRFAAAEVTLFPRYESHISPALDDSNIMPFGWKLICDPGSIEFSRKCYILSTKEVLIPTRARGRTTTSSTVAFPNVTKFESAPTCSLAPLCVGRLGLRTAHLVRSAAPTVSRSGPPSPVQPSFPASQLRTRR
jgi:hypothetical protein